MSEAVFVLTPSAHACFSDWTVGGVKVQRAKLDSIFSYFQYKNGQTIKALINRLW